MKPESDPIEDLKNLWRLLSENEYTPEPEICSPRQRKIYNDTFFNL